MDQIKECIEALEKKEAAIIDCPKCNQNTFIGVAQGFDSEGKSYPIGNCCICDISLNNLNNSTDVMLMMEFRNDNWDKWVLFCMKQKYEPLIRGD